MNARLVLLGASFSLLGCATPGASEAPGSTGDARAAAAGGGRGAMNDQEAMRGIEALRRRDEAASKA